MQAEFQTSKLPNNLLPLHLLIYDTYLLIPALIRMNHDASRAHRSYVYVELLRGPVVQNEPTGNTARTTEEERTVGPRVARPHVRPHVHLSPRVDVRACIRACVRDIRIHTVQFHI